MNKKMNYFPIIFTLIILYLSFLLIKPFIGSLVSAIIISYILYPFYKKINIKLKHKNLSLLLILLVIVFLILIPLGLILYSLVDDMTSFLDSFKNMNNNSLVLFKLDTISPSIRNYLVKIFETVGSGILSGLSKFVIGFPYKFFSVIVFLFAVTLFLKDGADIVKKFKITIPIEKVQKESLFSEFEIVTKGMIYSIFLTAIFNGVIGTIIFYLFGIPNAILWGFTMIILSFVPIIGNVPVWIGGVIYLTLLGNYPLAVLLMVLEIIIANLDNLLIIKFIGKKSKINSFLMFIGIISGIKVFGALGIILGPLILSILITLIRFYTKDYKKKFDF